MFNPYDILGVAQGSTKDVARAAYRRLAMKYHPDRNAGPGYQAAEEKFKQIKGAWEMIDNGWSAPIQTAPQASHFRPSSAFTKPEPVWEGYAKPEPSFNPFQQHRSPFQQPRANPWVPPRPPAPKVITAYPRENLGEFVARPSMAEAFNGFILEVAIGTKKHQVTMPKGIPHGMRNTIPIDENSDITVTTLFTQSMYKFVGLDTALREGTIVNSEPGIVFRTKDLHLTLEITDKELYNGHAYKVQDFLGEEYSIRVPSQAQSIHSGTPTIRVPNRGYVDWYTSHSQAGSQRGDVIVHLIRTEKVDATNLGR